MGTMSEVGGGALPVALAPALVPAASPVQSVVVQAAPALDVAQAVERELSRRERAKAEAEQADAMARFKGGPCWSCGATFSWVRVLEQTAVTDRPGWQAAGLGRTICHSCSEDRTFGGRTLSDSDWRGGVALELLRAAGRASTWIAPAIGARLTAAKTRLFWAEHKPSPPTHTHTGAIAERFSFVDVDAVLAVLEPPVAPYVAGPGACRCGAVARWVLVPEHQEATRLGDSMINVTMPTALVCADCGHEQPVDDSRRGGGLATTLTTDLLGVGPGGT